MFPEADDQLPDLTKYQAKQPKIARDDTAQVASVVDDELSKLGWSENARLSMLGDLGRENGWRRSTIFGGHKDPKNNAENLGIVSYQGSRRTNLVNYLGGDLTPSDDNLRKMVRFMDDEMEKSPEYKKIHSSLRRVDISTKDASDLLHKYIKYVPVAPYNTPDAEFKTKNNRIYAMRAKKLGLGSLPDLSSFAAGGEDLPDLSKFSVGGEEQGNASVQNQTFPLNQSLTTPTPQPEAPETDIESGTTPEQQAAADAFNRLDLPKTFDRTVPANRSLPEASVSQPPAEFIPPSAPGEILTFDALATDDNPPNPFSAPLDSEYKKYLAYTKKAPTPETRAEFENLARSNPELQANVSAKTGAPAFATRQIPPQINASAAAPAAPTNPPPMQNPTSFAPGTADNLEKEIVGNAPFQQIYKTKPTAEQVFRDFTVKNYGANAFKAFESYRAITGKPLLAPRDPAKMQSDIDNYWNPKTGEYDAGVASPVYANVKKYVEAFEQGGEQGLKDAIENAQTKIDVAEGAKKSEDVQKDFDLRQQAIKDIQTDIDANADPLAAMNPGVSLYKPPVLDEDTINRKVQEYKNAELSPEKADAAKNVASNLNDYLGENLGALAGGVIGSGGRVFQSLAGAARPLNTSLYNEFSKIAKYNESIEAGTGGDGVVSKVLKFGGALPGDISQVAVLSKLPGGAVIGFGVHSGLQASGAGASFGEIQKQAAKGSTIGALFPASSVVGAAAGKISPYLTSIAKIGTVGIGTTGVELAFGAPIDEAVQSGIMNGVFEASNIYGEKLLNKVARIWSKGEAHDVHIDEQGKVSLVRFKSGENPNRVDFEMVLDPTDGVYKASGENAPAARQQSETPNSQPPTEKQPIAVKGEIGETIPPRELAAKNPLRVENPSTEAVQKAQIDTRAQKVSEVLRGKDAVSIDDIAKRARINKNNVEDAVMTLYAARAVEILPDNSIRAISAGNIQTAPVSLYEKAARSIAPTEPIKLNQSSVENEIKTEEDSTYTANDDISVTNDESSVTKPLHNEAKQNPVVLTPTAENTNSQLHNETADAYKNLPEQKPQPKAEEKPAAKVIYAERPNIAEKLNVFTERGTKAAIEPKVVDTSDLLTSLDEGYPSEFQPRDRSRAASKAQISEIANKLNPEFLGDSPKASDGRPLVVPVEMPDGKTKFAVISGNGRTAGIREAYNSGNENARKYADFAKAKDENSNHQQPVYVGVLDPLEIKNLPEFAKEANESATAQMSATEQAKSDAGRMTGGLMQKFVPADDGSIHTSANRDFVRGFIENVSSVAERGKLQMPDGSLSQEGAARVRNAIFARAFGDSDAGMNAISRMAESTDNNVKNITNALLKNAGKLADLKDAALAGTRHAELDITNDLAKAMAKFSHLKDSGSSAKEYLQQQNLFGDDLSPFQKRVLQVFDDNKRSQKNISGILSNYALVSNELGDPNQANLFGSEKPHAASIFEAAIKEYEKGKTDDRAASQAGLFSNPNQRTQNQSAAGEHRPNDNPQGAQKTDGTRQNRIEPPPFSKPDNPRNQTLSSKNDAVAKRFETVVEDYFAGKLKHGSNQPVMTPPGILQKLGSTSKLVTIHKAILDKVTSNLTSTNKTGKNEHHLTKANLKALPEALSNPVMVFDSTKKDGSLVFVTDLKDAAGDAILIIVKPNVQTQVRVAPNKIENLQIDIIPSAYGKESKVIYNDWIKQGLLRYVNQQKTRSWLPAYGSNLPLVEKATTRATSNILTERDFVNDFPPKRADNKEQILKRALTTVAEKSHPVTELLKTAKIRGNSSGEIFPNPEAHEILKQAYKIAFEDDELGIFYGTYLNPSNVERVQSALWKVVGGMPEYEDRQAANKFLGDFGRAVDAKYGDLVHVSTSDDLMLGLSEAVQEERAHRADWRIGLEHSVGREVIQNDVAGRIAMRNLDEGGYEGASDGLLAIEVAAKLFVDDTRELGLSARQTDALAEKYITKLLDNGVTAEDIEKEISHISEKGKKYARRAKEIEFQRNSGTNAANEAARTAAVSLDLQGNRKIRQRSGSVGDADSAGEFGNLGSRILDAARSGNESLNSYQKPENTAIALRSADSTIKLATFGDKETGALYKKATPEEKTVVQTIVSKAIWNGRESSAFDIITSVRRAGLLTGVKTHLRNILGNTAFQISEEAHRPISALADIAVSAKTGTRTVQGLSPIAVAKSFTALVRQDKTLEKLDTESGIKTAWQILRNGDTKENLEKQQLSEMKSGLPILDTYVKGVFRLLSAEDAIFKIYSLRRALEEQASTLAQTEYRTNKSTDWRARRKELLENPTAEMQAEAVLYADFMTFQNNNKISTAVASGKKWLKENGSAGNAAVFVTETIVPFDRTPTNIVLRVLDYTPLGLLRANASLGRLRKGTSEDFEKLVSGIDKKNLKIDARREEIRKRFDEKFQQRINEKGIELSRINNEVKSLEKQAQLPDSLAKRLGALKNKSDKLTRDIQDLETARKVRKAKNHLKDAQLIDAEEAVEEMMKTVFSRREQQDFANSVGRASLGSAALALGILLASKELLSGVWDAGDKDQMGEFFKRKNQDIENGSLEIPNVGRFVITDSPMGKIMATGATIYERSMMNKKAKQDETDKVLDIIQDTGFSLVKDQPLLNAIDDYFGRSKTIKERAGGLLSSFVPSILNSFAEASDSQSRDAKGSILAPSMKKIPFLRENLPLSKYPRSPFLRDTTNRTINQLDPTNYRPPHASGMTLEQKQQQIESLRQKRDAATGEKSKAVLTKMIENLEK